jgi:hippurate hydrolase
MSVAPAVARSAAQAAAAIGADAARLQRLFRTLHEEMRGGRAAARVAGTIARELQEHGFEVSSSREGTEVIATLRNGPGPTLIYRTDTGSETFEQASASAGTADHGCGHDASIAWMLGMASALVTLRDEWRGTLVLVSQPTRLLRGGMPAAAHAGAEGSAFGVNAPRARTAPKSS